MRLSVGFMFYVWLTGRLDALAMHLDRWTRRREARAALRRKAWRGRA